MLRPGELKGCEGFMVQSTPATHDMKHPCPRPSPHARTKKTAHSTKKKKNADSLGIDGSELELFLQPSASVAANKQQRQNSSKNSFALNRHRPTTKKNAFSKTTAFSRTTHSLARRRLSLSLTRWLEPNFPRGKKRSKQRKKTTRAGVTLKRRAAAARPAQRTPGPC